MDTPTPHGTTTARPPRPSATLVLVREGDRGPEVLLVRRADRNDQNSNAWVFPGGLVDASDRLVHPYCDGVDDATISARLGVADGGLDFLVAALRETLEEVGVLLAVDAAGRALDAAAAPILAEWRQRIRDLPNGESGAALAELCRLQRWRLAAGDLVPIAHWITPLGMPKRFDTRFLLARVPAAQPVIVDGVEIVDHRWLRPVAALDSVDGGRVTGPARAVLQELSGFASTQDIHAWAAALGLIEPIQPRLGRDAEGRIGPVHPKHPAYAEIGRIDPHGHGLASHAIRPGEAVRLAPGVIRVTAHNGSVMTGPGTNSYLLRCGRDDRGDWVLIDPGPIDEPHVGALLGHLPGRLAAIVVTHTHIDHSPASRRVQALTGAPIHGRVADHAAGQDAEFSPDVALQGGERLAFGDELALRVIHTPGHASNHLCFLHEGQRLLFTGDHVMQGSTVVINPPDGDMAAYLASLARLAAGDDPAEAGFDAIAPGHGFLIEQPRRLLHALIQHRLRREAKVAEALERVAAAQPASLDELVVRVYDDVSADRHPIARRSLLAHLLHLQAQGRARESDGRWQPA